MTVFIFILGIIFGILFSHLPEIKKAIVKFYESKQVDYEE